MIPEHGYLLPLWGAGYNYRSTAVAYMKREGIESVGNKNGSTYTLEELEAALIGNTKN